MASEQHHYDQAKDSTFQNPQSQGWRSMFYWLWIRKAVIFLLIVCATVITNEFSAISFGTRVPGTPPQCPQVPALYPSEHANLWKTINKTITSDAFTSRAVNWLAGAVRIKTESYDKMGPVGIDLRWEAFMPFHNYLREVFPLVHSMLLLKTVNTYGLLFTWEGKDRGKKPILLVAHQDVVPVDPSTVEKWLHPPYSGYLDGTLDDKNGLVGILSTIEVLLEGGFRPSRTVVLAFGFDEEASGLQVKCYERYSSDSESKPLALKGAHKLSATLEAAYGRDSFAMIIDEGSGFMEQYNSTFAIIVTTEKGYLDTRIDVALPGGHSSVPPEHTSIGILAAAIVEIESQPYPVHLERASPVYASLQCYAEHAVTLPLSLRKLIKESAFSDNALEELEKRLFSDGAYKSLVGTTQAVDLIQGGVKANALPERAFAVVNNRISTESSVDATKRYYASLIAPLARKYNLTFRPFREHPTSLDVTIAAVGTMMLSDAWDSALEPAPVSPTGPGAVAYQLLSGSIKGAYNSRRSLQGDNIATMPGIMSGNTGIYLINHAAKTSHICYRHAILLELVAEYIPVQP
ncbi:hypothetical protein HGRIS_004794 [Hohenbuehelia grisea]|uniref:Peptidase M20 dimerisation domain-containing protein n=1 Tax=Hohenbuehelia grisea TaxID=104357 RepID=A0ABR3JD13_9AGAR